MKVKIQVIGIYSNQNNLKNEKMKQTILRTYFSLNLGTRGGGGGGGGTHLPPSPPQKKNYLLQGKPLKMMKNAIYFILKAFSVFKILKFLLRPFFCHVEKTAWLEIYDGTIRLTKN